MEPLGLFGMVMYLWNHWGDIQNQWQVVLNTALMTLGAIVALASLITPLTKTPKDDEFLAKAKAWLHQFSITNPKE